MIWSSTFYALATLTTALIAGGLAALAWRRRTTPGGATFALLMTAVAWWALMGALEYSVVTVRGKIFFSQLSYIGIVSIGPLWYLFAAHYCGYDKGLTRWRVAALWALPVAILGAVATNSQHGLIWPEVSEVAPGSPNPILLYGHGPLFWVIAIYTYALMLIGTFILLWAAMQAPHVYRRQASMLAVAAIFPWVGNLLYVLGINPLPGLDLTLFAFMFAGAIVGYSMFRFQLFNILPVAQDALFTSLTDGVLIVDNQNRIIDINLAAQRMLGVPADVRGQPTTTVLARHKYFAAPFQDLAVAQVRINNNTPNSRWVDVRVSPIIDRRGQIAGQLAVIQDITARKEVELALRQSEASYRGLFNSVAEAIYVQDGEGRFLDVNAGAVQMYGYPRKSLIGKTPEALGAPGRNDIKQVDSAVKRALAGEPQEFEFWGQRANGEVFPKDVRLYKATYFGKDVVIALAQDITERKLAEAALRESEARYRDLIQKQGEGIAVVDGNQRFVFVNPAAEQILGFEAGTLTGRSLRDILEPDQVDYAKTEWGPERTHDSVEFELAAIRRNGERRWLHITATPNPGSCRPVCQCIHHLSRYHGCKAHHQRKRPAIGGNPEARGAVCRHQRNCVGAK
ncbi:MAG: PAS domain S-box protein [Anaerolineales bacterium]|nr:PAS domain S-box protein [Anaerolineales bacterium]